MSKLRRRAANLAVAIAALSAVVPSAVASAGSKTGSELSAPSDRAIVMVVRPGDVGDGGISDPSTAAGERRARTRISSVVARNDLDKVRSLPDLGGVVVQLGPGESFAELRERLAGQPGVVSVTPNYTRQVRYTPNDPGFSSYDSFSPNGVRQWNLISEGFQKAWGFSRGSGVLVGVLDTGIYSGHPDLAPRISTAIDWSSSGGPNDTYGHGSHVAGLACGQGDNGYGMVGAGFNCGLAVEKIGPGPELYDDAIANGIHDAVNRGAKVLNMSFGGGDPDPLLDSAIAYAWGLDVVIVAAANNSSTSNQGYPARYLVDGTSNTLGAGRGLVVTGAYANGANAGTGFGSGVSMAAYGFSASNLPGIFSTFPANCTEIENSAVFGCTKSFPPRNSFNGDDRFAHIQGTSMATPQVAGAAALIRSIKPKLTAHEVITILERDANGTYSSALGWGILDAGTAVESAAVGAKCTKHYKKKKRRFWRHHKSKKQRKKWKRTHIRC